MDQVTPKEHISASVISQVAGAAQQNLVECATSLARSFSPPVFNPFAGLFDAVTKIQENFLEPVLEVARTADRLLESYQEMIKQARENMLRIARTFGESLRLRFLEGISEWVKGFEYVNKKFHEYDVLKRASKNDLKAYREIPHLFPIQFRHYKQLHKDEWTAEEFANIVLMKFINLLEKFQNLEEQVIDRLFMFLEQLFFALEDIFSDIARDRHFNRLNRDGLHSAAIIHNDVRYVLIPSLAFTLDMKKSTLRRWAQQSLIQGAIKLPYTKFSGVTQDTWYIPLTKETFRRLEELKNIPERKSKHSVLGLMNRQEASRASGVPESTLKFWEKRGLIAPDRRGRKVIYTEDHLEKLAGILNQKRQPNISTSALQFVS